MSYHLDGLGGRKWIGRMSWSSKLREVGEVRRLILTSVAILEVVKVID